MKLKIKNLKRNNTITIILATTFIISSMLTIIKITFASPPTVNTTTPLNITNGTDKGNWSPMGSGTHIPNQGICFDKTQNEWIVTWPQVAGTATINLYYSYSSDGFTWTTPAILLTTSSPYNFVGQQFLGAFSCNGNTGYIVYTGAAEGTTNLPYYNKFDFTNLASPIITYATDQQETGFTIATSSSTYITIAVDDSGGWSSTVCDNAVGSLCYITQNGAFIPQNSPSFINPINMNNGNGNVQQIQYAATTQFMDAVSTGGLILDPNSYYKNSIAFGDTIAPISNTGGIGLCPASTICLISGASAAGSLANNQCYVESFNTQTRQFVQLSSLSGGGSLPSTCAGGGGYAYTNDAMPYLTTDSNPTNQGGTGTSTGQNVWLIFDNNDGTTFQVWGSNDYGNTWLITPFPQLTGSIYLKSYSMQIVTINGQLQAIALLSMNSAGGQDQYIQTFYIGTRTVTTTTTLTNSIIIGCNANGGSDNALSAGNTYWYSYQVVIRSGTWTNVSSTLTNTGGSPQTINFALYRTSFTGSISSGNPLNVIIWNTNFSVPATTTDKVYWFLPNVPASLSFSYGLAIGLPSASTTLKIRNGLSCANNLNIITGDIPKSISTITAAAFSGVLFADLAYLGFITTTISLTTSIFPTTTIIVTSTLTALASPTGGGLILTDLITYLPIWILPLIFAKMLGTTGLLYGLMISLLLGVFLGLFPYWTIFILILMIYFLLR